MLSHPAVHIIHSHATAQNSPPRSTQVFPSEWIVWILHYTSVDEHSWRWTMDECLIISCPYWKRWMFLLRCYLTKEILLVKDKGSRVPWGVLHSFTITGLRFISRWWLAMLPHEYIIIFSKCRSHSLNFMKQPTCSGTPNPSMQMLNLCPIFWGGNSEIGRLYRYIMVFMVDSSKYLRRPDEGAPAVQQYLAWIQLLITYI